MKRVKILLTLIVLLAFICFTNNSAITVHTVGDSTMEQKAEDSTSNPNGQRGWAQMLPLFVINGATINDRAKSGTSSKTFYTSDRFWVTVTPQISAGDYVIIQFGHNDEKDGGWQSDHDGTTYTGIGTNPWEQYTRFLKSYINDVRALGAIPVLFTPIVRNGFTGASMTSTACHNIGTDSIGRAIDYPAAARQVAADMNCALIDHTALTKAYCESIGSGQTTSLIYNVGDGTHLGIFGATTYARLAVKEMIRQGILTNYFNANPSILVSPTSLAFGKCYVNASSVSQVSLSGTDLTPAEGTLTVTAPTGYVVSTSQNGTYSSTLEYKYTLGAVNLTNFYVKFSPTVTGTYKDSLVVTNGTLTKKIAVSGECISLSGGQKASAYWLLSANTSYTSTGAITVIPETYSNMNVSSYAVPGSTTTWSDGLVTTNPKTQRNVILGGTWPAGEIDIVNDRYIQFGVTSVKGTDFLVDSIGFYAGGAGGSGMRFKVYISKDSLFSSDVTMIADRQSNTSNTMYPISYNKLTELVQGESLYVRVFPWYNGTASGKTICLYGVTIKGSVIEDTNPIAQKISFAAIPTKKWGDAPFTLSASGGASGNPVVFASSNSSVATITGTTVTITGIGTSIITASQTGNTSYSDATPVQQTLTVTKGTPVITWDISSPLANGTVLNSSLLTATATGTTSSPIYSPAAGTTLNLGSTDLTVSYDATDYYEAVSKTISVYVTDKQIPTITWNTPAAITYGTALGATQLNASSSGTSVSPTYTPASGTILTSGSQTLSVYFPGDATYEGVTKTIILIVNKAIPTITWANPSAITYGTALSATQLNASVLGNGTVSYTPASGNVLSAGSQTLRADFAESTNYLAASKTVTLVVNKATPTVTWATPSAITYGTTLSATQLNASVLGNGTATYSPVSGTILNAGTQSLRVDFAESTNYLAASKTVNLTVNKATPAIIWTNPAAITYGTALSSTQLNASVSALAGTVTYTSATGTILNAGTYTITVNVAATDNYNAASKTVTITVNKAVSTIAWVLPATIEYGTLLDVSLLNAAVTGSSGAVTYSETIGTKLTTGTHSITVNVAADANYEAASKTVSIQVKRAATSIIWSTPSAITYGTGLSDAQLNAEISGSTGTVTYSLASGTILSAGNQTITVSVEADDNYRAASKSITLIVNKAATSISWPTPASIIYGEVLSALQLNAVVTGSNGIVSYSPALGSKLSAGLNTISLNVEADENYEAAQKTITLLVNKAASVVTWDNPASIEAGTALSATQLNASVTGTSGTASYTPAIGTVLEAGSHTLTVVFAADNNYEAASKSVTIEVTSKTSVKTSTNIDVNVYPNPVSNGVMNISISNFSKETRLTVISTKGNIVLSKVLKSQISNLDVNNLPDGLLIFKFENNDGVTIKQVIKQ